MAERTVANEKSVKAKAGIVADDERETSGSRALFNLGPAFGYALEAETGFSDTLLHGEAVAAGMALAFRFSARQGRGGQDEAYRATMHLLAVDLTYDMARPHVSSKRKLQCDPIIHKQILR